MVLNSQSVGPSVALGPTRDVLDELRLFGGNSLQALLELLPDTWHSKETGRPCPLERVYQGSLQSVRSSEIEFTDIAHVLENIEAQASDM